MSNDRTINVTLTDVLSAMKTEYISICSTPKYIPFSDNTAHLPANKKCGVTHPITHTGTTVQFALYPVDTRITVLGKASNLGKLSFFKIGDVYPTELILPAAEVLKKEDKRSGFQFEIESVIGTTAALQIESELGMYVDGIMSDDNELISLLIDKQLLEEDDPARSLVQLVSLVPESVLVLSRLNTKIAKILIAASKEMLIKSLKVKHPELYEKVAESLLPKVQHMGEVLTELKSFQSGNQYFKIYKNSNNDLFVSSESTRDIIVPVNKKFVPGSLKVKTNSQEEIEALKREIYESNKINLSKEYYQDNNVATMQYLGLNFGIEFLAILADVMKKHHDDIEFGRSIGISKFAEAFLDEDEKTYEKYARASLSRLKERIVALFPDKYAYHILAAHKTVVNAILDAVELSMEKAMVNVRPEKRKERWMHINFSKVKFGKVKKAKPTHIYNGKMTEMSSNDASGENEDDNWFAGIPGIKEL